MTNPDCQARFLGDACLCSSHPLPRRRPVRHVESTLAPNHTPSPVLTDADAAVLAALLVEKDREIRSLSLRLEAALETLREVAR